MNLLSVIFLAVGLAMDCFAVSLTKGFVTGRNQQWHYALLMALCFGLYQGIMPLLSYFAGISFNDFFDRWTHWIALILLSVIGGKMIYEGFVSNKETQIDTDIHPTFSFLQIQLLAIATSIDAFATGVLFISTPQILWIAIAIIAFVSLLFSVIGYWLGCKFGTRFSFNTELVGGFILVGIGLKIFLEYYI